MGVKREADCEGNHSVELVCRNGDCEIGHFWTDETQGNSCPECNELSYKPANTTAP